MIEDEREPSTGVAERVNLFYEDHPYPPPSDDIDAYRRRWSEDRRRADSHFFWPAEPFREDRTILVAGCGTMQAAHYAARWPRARVFGIDVSATSIAFTQTLKEKYALENLEVRQLPLERAGDLAETFDHIVCTGVLHHLPEPDTGLRALRDVLKPNGAMHLMLYAPYGRAGIYLLQDYCRRLGVGWTAQEVRDLAATLKALPQNHPIVPLLRASPDFANIDGVADALLHPNDRSFSIPQLMEFLDGAGLMFGRWIRQAPYLPWCGAIASTPHKAKLVQLPPHQQYAALELFRGTLARHSFAAYSNERATLDSATDFDREEWLDYIPIRVPDTILVRDRLPAGSSGVLINRNHTESDLYLPITEREEHLLANVDGRASIGEICKRRDANFVRMFFEKLWRWDQVVFDTSRVAS